MISFLQTHRRFLISEVLLIALAPILSYVLLLAFNYGTAYYFGIPPAFIAIDTSSAVVLPFFILGGIFLTLLAGEAATCFIPNNPEYVILIRLKRIMPLAAVFLGFAWYVGNVGGWPIFILAGMVIVAFAGVDFIAPLFQHRGIRGYANKLRQATSPEKYSSFWRYLYFTTKSTWLFTLVVMFVFFFTFATLWGIQASKNREYYYVIDGNPQRVVLDSYGDTIVAAEFKELWNGPAVLTKFYLIDPKQNPNLSYSYRRLGHVHVYAAEK